MRFINTILMSGALLSASVALATAQVANPRDAVDVMVQAVATRDAAAVAALYAPESVALSPGQPPLSGREEIRAAWERNFQSGYSALEVGSPRTERGADRAAMLFYWRATIQPPGQQASQILGRSLLYFIQTEDGWLISADMWQPPEG